MNDIMENLIRTHIRTNLQSRYFNQPPRGGYIINEEEEYLDDITSTVLLSVITEFGSPENISFFKNQRINEINTIKYKKIKESDPLIENVCSICLENFKKGECYKKLVCNHVFHKKCIDPWLKKDHSDCPYCRTKVL